MTPFERLTSWLAAVPVGRLRSASINSSYGRSSLGYDIILCEAARQHDFEDDDVVEVVAGGELLDETLARVLDAMDKVLASRGDGVGPDL